MGKLNHLPFSEWIQSGESLTSEQERSLQEHLRSCPACSQVQAALTEVQFVFQSSGMTYPAIGFAERWQQRLVFHRARQQRRNAWILFFATTSLAVIILSLLSWRIFAVFNSKTTILTSLVYLWTYALVFAERMQDLVWGLVRLLPPISYLGLVFFVGFFSLLSVLWLVTYRKLTTARRAVK